MDAGCVMGVKSDPQEGCKTYPGHQPARLRVCTFYQTAASEMLGSVSNKYVKLLRQAAEVDCYEMIWQ
jgi:hypothetical protein